jgi:hypothetical protein
MTRKLKEDDRAAVDLLLDRSAAASKQMVVAPLNATGRVEAASRVLRALAAMPALDPPADLLARTMRRIDRTVATMPGEREAQAPYVNRHHPLM